MITDIERQYILDKIDYFRERYKFVEKGKANEVVNLINTLFIRTNFIAGGTDQTRSDGDWNAFIDGLKEPNRFLRERLKKRTIRQGRHLQGHRGYTSKPSNQILKGLLSFHRL